MVTDGRRELQGPYIGELGQLCVGGLHAQVLADLARESRARVAGEDKCISHGSVTGLIPRRDEWRWSWENNCRGDWGGRGERKEEEKEDVGMF